MEINRIIQGHALDILKGLPDQLVDCVITSPPYWSKRNYKTEPVTWSDGWKGELGLEPSIELYLVHLLSIFDQVGRVMKDEATLWVNLGDSFSGSWGNYGDRAGGQREKTKETYERPGSLPEDFSPPLVKSGIPAKSLCLIPQRFAIAMVDRGWILRNTVIWHKPNCMPESVKDRFTIDFEYVYFFAKKESYYFEQQYEDVTGNTHPGRKDGQLSPYYQNDMGGFNRRAGSLRGNYIPAERNMRTVWTIPSAAYSEAHFATFPPKLVEPMVLAGCPELVCLKCGKGRENIYEGKSGDAFNIRVRDVKENRIKHTDRKASTGEVEDYDETEYGGEGRRLVGLTDCGCGAGWGPGLVLDPFIGSGTVAFVAAQNRRNYFGIDLSTEYNEMSDKRIFDPNNSQIKLF